MNERELATESKAELVDAMREWITREYGKKCEDYAPECILCSMWRVLEEFERG